MRKINTLQFEEQIFIWLIRQKRMLNKERELHIWFCLNKILTKKGALEAYRSIKNLVNILPKINHTELFRSSITIEEEKILSIYVLANHKDEKNIKNKILNSLNIKSSEKQSLITEISNYKEQISKSNNCYIRKGFKENNTLLTNLTSFQILLIKSIRVWHKALQQNLDMFGMLYKFHIEQNCAILTISLHSFIEKIYLEKNKLYKL
tara:strand:+ start:208 stop:828 length:621 start_codon:yes stop_codon:yes gene_type:complete